MKEAKAKFQIGDLVVPFNKLDKKYYVVSAEWTADNPEWRYTCNWYGTHAIHSEVFLEHELVLYEEVEEKPIKDSGERTEFDSGAVRDMHEGKGDMLSMPWAALLRVSKHYENGAKKYGRFNYQKGIPVSSFLDSAMRHLAKYIAGYDDEDHLSAAAFNVLGAIQMEETKPDMCDIETRKDKRTFSYESSPLDDIIKKIIDN